MLNNASSGLALIVITCIIVAVCLTGLAIVVVIFGIKNKKDILSLQQHGINVTAQIDNSVPLILETIINECFTDYCIMNLSQYGEGVYIDDETEKKIRTDIVEMVSNRISPSALDKLSLYYNLVSIANVIADKIYILVMGYVVNQNRIIDEPPQKGPKITSLV